jgi:hypothetical protein
MTKRSLGRWAILIVAGMLGIGLGMPARSAPPRPGHGAKPGLDVRTGITWVAISGGTYQMGSKAGTAEEKPVHRVTGCRFRSTPQGLFGWLDCGVDTGHLAATMLDQGWLLAPGSLFMPDHRASTCMRINFATSQDRRFWDDFEAVRARLGGHPVSD